MNCCKSGQRPVRKHRLHCILTCAVLGKGGAFTPPQVFRKYIKNGGRQRRRFRHTCLYILSAHVKNFRPRSLTVRSPGHVKLPYLRKSLNARQSHSECAIILKLSEVDIRTSIYKIFISNFISVTQGQANFVTSPLQVNGRKAKGASFGRKPFETPSNIGLQVDLTP